VAVVIIDQNRDLFGSEFLRYECMCCGGSIASLPLDARCSVGRHFSYCSGECEGDWEAFLDEEDAKRAAIRAYRAWEDSLYDLL